MPLNPTGLDAQSLGRIRSLVRQQLGQTPTAPAPVSQPLGPSQPQTQPQAPQDLQVQPVLQTPEQPVPDFYPVRDTPSQGLDDVKMRIQLAGGSRPPLLLDLNYTDDDGKTSQRRVEPLSYRYRDADNAQLPLLYAWCRNANGLRSFKLTRINDVRVTGVPFSSTSGQPVEF